MFLNHGSFGACPRPVFDRYQAWQLELEREPVEFLGRERRLGERLESARLRLAAYLGADPANIAFVPNTSTALDKVARSLELGPGDEILMGDEEYGGVVRLWTYVAGRTGATCAVSVRRARPSQRTRVVFCSHVEWTTGRINDVAEACRRARAAGALSIVDGAHAPGQLELSLDAIGADVYAGNCHKWLSAPKGSAFLYVRQETQLWSSRSSCHGTGTRSEHVARAEPLAGHARPCRLPERPGGDRLPGRARLVDRARALPPAARACSRPARARRR